MGTLGIQQLQNAVKGRTETLAHANVDTPSKIGCALGGKVGKVLGGLKFAERGDPGFDASKFGPYIADVMVYLCMVANMYEVDMEEAVALKFNADSRKLGSTWTLPGPV